MWGLVCDMDAIMKVARKHKLLVVEDCCQCVGGAYKGRTVGSIGHVGAFSFNFYKNMTCGEGGAFVTNDDRGRPARGLHGGLLQLLLGRAHRLRALHLQRLPRLGARGRDHERAARPAAGDDQGHAQAEAARPGRDRRHRPEAHQGQQPGVGVRLARGVPAAHRGAGGDVRGGRRRASSPAGPDGMSTPNGTRSSPTRAPTTRR